MADFVWPEDQGTNSGIVFEGDKLYAANLGAGYYYPNGVDFVVEGMGLTHDTTNNTLTIGSGKARLSANSAAMADGSGDRGPVCYTVEIETRTGIDLIDEATNHIYLTLPLDGNDMVDIAVLPAGDAPPQPFLKLGTVDATTDVTVSITGTNEPVEEGDTLTVDYEATNDGTIQDTQDIELEVQ